MRVPSWVWAAVLVATAGCNIADIVEDRVAPLEERDEELAARDEELAQQDEDLGQDDADLRDDVFGTGAGSVAERLAALEALATTQAGQIAALQAELALERERLDSIDGCWIMEDTTWVIGGSTPHYADPWEALDAANQCRIGSGATLTLSVQAGTYTGTRSWFFTHPDGDRIRLVGAGVDDTIMEFDGSSGVIVDDASSLRLVTGLTLKGVGTSSTPTTGLWAAKDSYASYHMLRIEGFNGVGVRLNSNSTIVNDVGDSELVVQSVGRAGLLVDHGSFLRLAATTVEGVGASGAYVEGSLEARSIKIRSSGEPAVLVQHGGNAHIQSATIDLSSTPGTIDGIVASDGSYVDARNAEITEAAIGIYATRGSVVQADEVEISAPTATSGGTGRYGVFAEAGSTIVVNDGTITDTRSHGILAEGNSTVYADNAELTDNGAVAAIALNGSVIHGSEMLITRPWSAAVVAEFESFAMVQGVEVDGGLSDGLIAKRNATIDATDAVIDADRDGLGALIGGGVVGDMSMLTGTRYGVLLHHGSWAEADRVTFSGFSGGNTVVNGGSFIIP